MSAEAMVTTLKSLKLFGMAQAIDELDSQSAPAYQKAESILDSLVKAEMAEREVRSINYQMRIARFPAYRDLAGFVFDDSSVDETLVRALHRCEFLDDANNIVLSADRVRVKLTWPQPSGSRPSCTITGACGSSPLLNWSMPWSRKRLLVNRDTWPTG